MSKEPPAAGTPFNLDKLKELIEVMEKNGLTEIDLRSGAERWQLRRGPREITQVVPAGPYSGLPMAPPMPVTAAAPPFAGLASAAPIAPLPPPADDGITIKSPTVGTFYVAAAPGDAPFVSVGTKIREDTVVCIIEAMKVFNQIPAEVNGTITAILVKNGDPVEFGQPLFKVKLG